MIPQTLNSWTVESITQLLQQGIHENEQFDFKEDLPHSGDTAGKTRLRAACSALANSGGGFLVFGVADDRALAPRDRLVGLDPHMDFPERFGAHAAACDPTVDWEFLNPPLKLDNGNSIHVVHVPRSWRAPHGLGSPTEGWRFYKRTNKGNEGMSSSEIRSAFLNFYEKRIRLQLLLGELTALAQSANSMVVPDADGGATYSLVTLDTKIIDATISDTYPMLAESPNLVSALTQIRQSVGVLNNKVRIFYSIVALPISDKAQIVASHNKFVAEKAPLIVELCEVAARELRRIIGPSQ